MLLMKLQSKEKFSFLQLAHYLARVDDIYGEKEEEIIQEYCTEMGIENLTSFDKNSFDLEEILNDFKSLKSKKIVILELMILIHIDRKYHYKEKELIEKIIKKFAFNEEEIEKYSKWGDSVATLYEEAKSYIK
jgi:hypothetical protein